MFRLASLSAALLLGSALAASAADIPVETLPVPEAAAIVDWSGFYLGIAGGGGAVNYETEVLDILTIDGFGGEGWLVEGRGGYDLQLGQRFLVGVLAEGHYSELETSASLDFSDLSGDPDDDLGEIASLESRFGFSVMGRVGFLVNDSALLYALGGYAYQEFEGEFDLSEIADDFEDSAEEDADGFTVGAGIEARLTNHLSVFGEYRYTALDSIDFDTGSIDLGDDDLDLLEIDPSFHTGRVGLTYKFNGLFGG